MSSTPNHSPKHGGGENHKNADDHLEKNAPASSVKANDERATILPGWIEEFIPTTAKDLRQVLGELCSGNEEEGGDATNDPVAVYILDKEMTKWEENGVMCRSCAPVACTHEVRANSRRSSRMVCSVHWNLWNATVELLDTISSQYGFVRQFVMDGDFAAKTSPMRVCQWSISNEGLIRFGVGDETDLVIYSVKKFEVCP